MARPDAELSSLLFSIKPVTPQHTVDEVAQLLLAPEHKKLLCIPIVEYDGTVVGTLNRQRIQKIYVARFGRELYGRKAVTKVMNPHPLIVDVSQSVANAAQYISEKIEVPISEDFIITKNECYLGVGFVLDLLRAMEQQIHQRNEELAEAYKSLKASQSQLIQSEKMASLGQMVAGVAHEINTPLGYVRNNVELTQNIFTEIRETLDAFERFFMLLSSGEIDEAELNNELVNLEQVREEFHANSPLEDMEQLFTDTFYGVDQISEIVVNLKNFSRLDQAAVANININNCIESSLVIAKNVLKHKCDINKEFGDIPAISCSPSQINQVFLNLLTNAAHAMDTKGTITLTTWSEDNCVYARVADTGKGIPEDTLSKIFDPFFTTKPIGQGTGLGLSIVYSIVEQHHGEIRVNSTIGQGTQFTLSLPIATEDHRMC
ncbi:ATPase [Achromatium sp. WMS3]|nr:ATPase [Achromatium sp. WMS3]